MYIFIYLFDITILKNYGPDLLAVFCKIIRIFWGRYKAP